MRNLLLTAIVLLLPLTALAQQGTTGELTGVVSAGASPLPGVAITIASPALLGFAHHDHWRKRRVSFCAASARRLHGPLRVARPGNVAKTRAHLPRTDDARRRHPECCNVSDSISVNAHSFDATQVASSFRSDAVEQLPTGRTLRDTTLVSTNVNANGTRNRLLIAGAPFWSSMFLVDGAVVNDSLGGQPHDLFVEDAIEETTVPVGSISPEYGRER